MKYLIIIPFLILAHILISEFKDPHPKQTYDNGVRQGIHLVLGIVSIIAIIIMQMVFDY